MGISEEERKKWSTEGSYCCVRCCVVSVQQLQETRKEVGRMSWGCSTLFHSKTVLAMATTISMEPATPQMSVQSLVDRALEHVHLVLEFVVHSPWDAVRPAWRITRTLS